ncbi:urease accessory protein UreF [Ruegeria jejuensis]|uniref:urease accessory protein UreF n=1 Tax=Ruegeria jejuensis TaxID=3233338 RepID=UPI00355AD65A
MATPTETLTLLQWLSPAYPVSAYAYSHGLEAAVDQGWVTDAESFKAWLSDVLTAGSGRSDALFLAAAYHAQGAAALSRIDDLARAFAPARERLLETDQQGAAFCRTTRAVSQPGLGDWVYPVALGSAAAQEGLPLDLTQRSYLQAFVANLIAAAQRLLPLGQTEGQVMQHALIPVYAEVAQATEHGDLDALSGTTFLSDIAAMKHETQYSRIFRT